MVIFLSILLLNSTLSLPEHTIFDLVHSKTKWPDLQPIKCPLRVFEGQTIGLKVTLWNENQSLRVKDQS